MKLLATWRHSDGSLVQLSETGWRSTDPEKNEWLVKMSELCSTAPVIPPVIRMWLEEYCELRPVQNTFFARGILDSFDAIGKHSKWAADNFLVDKTFSGS
jgi:hypothetical protein